MHGHALGNNMLVLIMQLKGHPWLLIKRTVPVLDMIDVLLIIVIIDSMIRYFTSDHLEIYLCEILWC